MSGRCARGSADRSAKPTPGNKRGGLANIVEKALGSIAKAGSSAINAVASHGQKVTAKVLSHPDRVFAGKVDWVSDKPDPSTRVGKVRPRRPPPD